MIADEPRAGEIAFICTDVCFVCKAKIVKKITNETPTVRLVSYEFTGGQIFGSQCVFRTIDGAINRLKELLMTQKE